MDLQCSSCTRSVCTCTLTGACCACASACADRDEYTRRQCTCTSVRSGPQRACSFCSLSRLVEASTYGGTFAADTWQGARRVRAVYTRGAHAARAPRRLAVGTPLHSHPRTALPSSAGPWRVRWKNPRTRTCRRRRSTLWHHLAELSACPAWLAGVWRHASQCRTCRP